VLALGGCAAHTSLAPVGRGAMVPHASLGGPVVEALGTRLPIPYLTAGVTWGMSARSNLDANVHLLALAYGVAGVDIGGTWFLAGSDGTGRRLAVSPRALMLLSLRGGVEQRFRLYPALTATGTTPLGRGLGYAGVDVALQAGDLSYDPEAAGTVWSPFLGYRWPLGGVFLLTELKWQGANLATDQLAVSYLHPGGRGALAPLVAIQRRF